MTDDPLTRMACRLAEPERPRPRASVKMPPGPPIDVVTMPESLFRALRGESFDGHSGDPMIVVSHGEAWLLDEWIASGRVLP